MAQKQAYLDKLVYLNLSIETSIQSKMLQQQKKVVYVIDYFVTNYIYLIQLFLHNYKFFVFDKKIYIYIYIFSLSWGIIFILVVS